MKLCTVKTNNEYIRDTFFEDYVANIQDNKPNYEPLNLKKYIEYGYAIDNNDIVAMCGITDFGHLCYRVESACWINPKYRTTRFDPSGKYNHYALSEYQMDKYKVNVWLKSRKAKNPAGIARYVPEGWKVYPKEIELGWKNNWQWVVYKGNIDEYVDKIQAPNSNGDRAR